MQEKEFKRKVAYKLRIGDILSGKAILDEEKFKFLEWKNKQVVRINLIANIIDKFAQEGEKKYAFLTLDDATGQIKAKLFGEDIRKFNNLVQGDTVVIIGLLRIWNNEIYITPEIIKKKESEYLLIRKLELDIDNPKEPERSELNKIKEQILELVKQNEENGGLDTETMILKINYPPETLNKEIRKLLEEGLIYEPRPGKLRYLG